MTTAWNPAEQPYIATWNARTGDRLTRFCETVQTFATEDEALAAVNEPFKTGVATATIRKHISHTKCQPLWKRLRGKKIAKWGTVA